jgi:hypothetical protein
MKTGIDFIDCGLDGSVMPSQFNDVVRQRSPGTEGEYSLLRAVLESAIRGYQDNKSRSTFRKSKNFEELRAWFNLEDERPQGLFAFRTICELLKIEPSGVLRKLDSPICSRKHRRIRGKAPHLTLTA